MVSPHLAESSVSSKRLILRVLVCRSSLGLSLEFIIHVSGIFIAALLLQRAMTCE